MRNNKYFAEKVTLPTGEVFHSQAEYHRWCELRLLERAGKITKLQRQVKYELIPKQRGESTETYKAGPQKGLPKPGAIIEKAVNYIADFVYCDEKGNTVVEDTKGYKKGAAYDLFVIKRKLMLKVHGIRVIETGN
jgi:hypothetical protein